MAALGIKGRIVTMADPSDAMASLQGTLWLADGRVVTVTVGDAAAPAGLDTAPIVDVGRSWVLPGFIDMHNHIGYNALPLWSEPSQQVPFEHSKSWTRADTYTESVTEPAWCLATAAPEALLAYVQVRALVGGTTIQQGWPTANRKLDRVIRSVDADGGATSITQALPPLSPDELNRRAQQVRDGRGFVYHCAEGRQGSVVAAQFAAAKRAGCLQPTFVGVHCTAVSAEDWKLWPLDAAGALVWSPFSNYWLYGETTLVADARRRGVTLCLGSDWGPSGTKNILGELKVARIASDREGIGLTDEDLVAAVTTGPGKVLSACWDTKVGRLVTGAFADVTVVRERGNRSVARTVVDAREGDIALVVADGVARYGDVRLMDAAGATDTFDVTVSRRARRVRLAPRRASDPGGAPVRWTWQQIRDELAAVADDPEAAVDAAEARQDAFAGPLDDDDAPLILTLDMPPGANVGFAGRPRDLSAVRVPALPTLTHDAVFFDDIDAGAFHGGTLSKLRQRFR